MANVAARHTPMIATNNPDPVNSKSFISTASSARNNPIASVPIFWPMFSARPQYGPDYALAQFGDIDLEFIDRQIETHHFIIKAEVRTRGEACPRFVV